MNINELHIDELMKTLYKQKQLIVIESIFVYVNDDYATRLIINIFPEMRKKAIKLNVIKTKQNCIIRDIHQKLVNPFSDSLAKHNYICIYYPHITNGNNYEYYDQTLSEIEQCKRIVENMRSQRFMYA